MLLRTILKTGSADQEQARAQAAPRPPFRAIIENYSGIGKGNCVMLVTGAECEPASKEGDGVARLRQRSAVAEIWNSRPGPHSLK